ncbi:hypothetical protein RJ639_032972 [Escallonia herrerae]|uniref:Uncharacterized protein n=1 Tax=Escallonia herrerae TaxID=1293975 RepID=A0AA89BBJ7_9ASTE|nr:hypothetical protein RJ639_032972 [Escallonia herrerae]
MVGGAFWGTRVMEIVKKHDSGGKLWKRVKLTTTRKANAKKRTLRVWQGKHLLGLSEKGHHHQSWYGLVTCGEIGFLVVPGIGLLKVVALSCRIGDGKDDVFAEDGCGLNEAVLKACSEPPPSEFSRVDAEGTGLKESTISQD